MYLRKSPPLRSLNERIKDAIFEMRAIRYVKVSPSDSFLVIKLPGSFLEAGQDLGEIKSDYMLPTEFFGVNACFPRSPRNHCYILHKDRIISRSPNHGVVTKQALSKAGFNADMIFQLLAMKECLEVAKIISPLEAHIRTFDIFQLEDEFRDVFPKKADKILEFLATLPKGEVDDKYLQIYHDEINNAPEFIIDTFFTVKHRTASRTELGYEQLDKKDPGNTLLPDYLVPREEVKVHSPSHWRPICDLFRKVGLLKELRGKEKTADAITKSLRAFTLREFKSIKKKKPLPLKILRDRLAIKVNEYFSDDSDKAKKYDWSESTIRRVIESSIKK